MNRLWAQCKANQLDVIDMVISLVRDVEEAVVAGRDGDADRLLRRLTNIASTKPGNVLAAEAVADSLSEGMLTALVDRSIAALLLK